ncbi:uncharacterized protein [Epargyreus clarus]|uniref:uncharacterized protein n=1 Tax=Epargyreus clarus TaxID=520877 RepID=UPI003C2C2631
MAQDERPANRSRPPGTSGGVALRLSGSFIRPRPYIPQDEFGLQQDPFLRSTDEIASQWGPHVMDFLKLIDVEKVFMAVTPYMTDPEVLTFIQFALSPQFKELIWEFETMEEFKEAFVFMASKGYDMESVMIFINTALNLPPFEKPNVSRNGKGISGVFEAMVDSLPLDDMKKLFEIKLQTTPEIAQLFETINSQEFMDIMRKMHQNPKFKEFKKIFESYGFDFGVMCKLFKEIFGDYYQGVFCG